MSGGGSHRGAANASSDGTKSTWTVKIVSIAKSLSKAMPTLTIVDVATSCRECSGYVPPRQDFCSQPCALNYWEKIRQKNAKASGKSTCRERKKCLEPSRGRFCVCVWGGGGGGGGRGWNTVLVMSTYNIIVDLHYDDITSALRYREDLNETIHSCLINLSHHKVIGYARCLAVRNTALWRRMAEYTIIVPRLMLRSIER